MQNTFSKVPFLECLLDHPRPRSLRLRSYRSGLFKISVGETNLYKNMYLRILWIFTFSSSFFFVLKVAFLLLSGSRFLIFSDCRFTRRLVIFCLVMATSSLALDLGQLPHCVPHFILPGKFTAWKTVDSFAFLIFIAEECVSQKLTVLLFNKF